MINRQELYDLLCSLSCSDEVEHFCALSIIEAMPDFEESYENKDKLCIDSLMMLSDEDLHPIFHDTIVGTCLKLSTWYREHLPDQLLKKFPFLYEQTQHTLSTTIDRILYRHGGGMKFNDLCVEFMALHRDMLSDSERKNYRELLSRVIKAAPEKLTMFFYEGIESYEKFVGCTLSEKNRDLVVY